MKYGLFQRAPMQDNIPSLYGAIVAQARSPAFYRDYGVPDTLEGRLEMILLHTFLLSRRAAGSPSLARLAQTVFDLFCDDMDGNLRELGVGDLAVPKQMKRIGEAFYGRSAAYDAALATQDDTALLQALGRNVFADVPQAPERAIRLARYVRAADAKLSDASDGNLTAGVIGFPDPDIF